MTHVPRDTHVTKQRMAMRSNFPWSDFKKLGTPELSSSSSKSTALSPKNFEKRAHPNQDFHQSSFGCVARWTVYNMFGFETNFHLQVDAFSTLGCALFYKPTWQLTVNERGRYADSEDTFLFKIEDSPDTRLGA